jgi:hypothetical protein
MGIPWDRIGKRGLRKLFFFKLGIDLGRGSRRVAHVPRELPAYGTHRHSEDCLRQDNGSQTYCLLSAKMGKKGFGKRWEEFGIRLGRGFLKSENS